MTDTCTHEASHVACAVLLGREVDHTWRETGSVLPGETAGHARIPIRDRIETSQLPIALIGYMSTDTAGWPPAYADAREEELEALATIIDRLAITEAQYEEFVELTRAILRDEHLIRLQRSIANALAFCPRLDEQAIRDLSEVAAVPYPEPEGVPTP